MAGIRWADADARQVVDDAYSELITLPRGATHELQPLDLGHHPELAALVRVVDFEEILSA